MGLDQYWFATKTKEEKVEAVLKGKDPDEIAYEFGSHRKWWDLQEFMAGNYWSESKGDMNCASIYLTHDMITAIHDWAYDYVLESVGGDEDVVWDRKGNAEDLVNWTDEMHDALREGRDVIYHPWW